MKQRFIIATIMVLVSVVTVLITPKTDLKNAVTAKMLETMIPRQLDSWSVSDKVSIVLPAPTGGVASKIYDQTLARGYVNKDGKLIMLVIAYGSHQSDSLQLHLPQKCYAAIGYIVSQPMPIHIAMIQKSFPAIRLETSRDERFEPVTYWTRVGDDIPSGTWARQVTKLRYGLSGKIPDGVLVRISSIGANSKDEFALQNSFITSLLEHSDASTQKFLLGKYSSSTKRQG